LFEEVGVLSARHLVSVEISGGGECDAFEWCVEFPDGTPVFSDLIKAIGVEPGITGAESQHFGKGIQIDL
jgi:hypothetical protein